MDRQHAKIVTKANVPADKVEFVKIRNWIVFHIVKAYNK